MRRSTNRALRVIFALILKGAERLTCIALFLVAWEIIPRAANRYEWFDATFLPPFSVVAKTFSQLVLDGTLLEHAAVSLRRSAMGFTLACALAIPLGLAIGSSRVVERFCDPILQTFRQTAAMALFPVFVLLFGIGELSKIGLIYWGAQWPILIGTISGVKGVDPLLVKCARSMSIPWYARFYKVVIPAAFPSILTGIRLAATSSILILIAAEMIGANRGLGFLVYDSETRYEVPRMYAAICSLSLLGLLVNTVLVAAGRSRRWGWKERRCS